LYWGDQPCCDGKIRKRTREAKNGIERGGRYVRHCHVYTGRLIKRTKERGSIRVLHIVELHCLFLIYYILLVPSVLFNEATFGNVFSISREILQTQKFHPESSDLADYVGNVLTPAERLGMMIPNKPTEDLEWARSSMVTRV